MRNPTQYLTGDQIDLVLSKMDNPRDLTLFTFLAYSGRRVSEVVRCLKPKDIDTQNKMINYTILKKRTKGEAYKDFLAVNEIAFDKLVRWIEVQNIGREEFIFTISRQRADQLFKRYCYSAGIFTIGEGKYNKPHIHCLRHSFAIIGSKQCATLEDIYSLKKLLGHSNIQQTMWYVEHFNPKAQKKLVGKMFISKDNVKIDERQ